MYRQLRGLGRVTSLLALGSIALVAQGTQTANVTGKVVSRSGAPVAGAKIHLASSSLMGTRIVTTDEQGNFVARLLPPGTYTITIVKEGLQTIKLTEKLGVDQNFQPRIILPEVQGATVQVVATAAAVDKTDVKTATNYVLDQVDRLPTLNRNMETVALLTPGVVEGVGNRVQIRGAMTSGNLYLVDGQNISDNAYGDRGNSIIDDSIEEMQVITGAISAEYGSVEGGVLNSITRSGSNEFTGQLRWELSSGKWNALAPLKDPTTVPSNINQTLTFSGGGYLWKDRLWFFTSYFKTDSSRARSITSDSYDAPGFAGADYAYSIKEIRRQLKLTFLVNQDHTIVLSYNNSQNAEKNRDYLSGGLESLVPQRYNDEFWNLAFRSVWSSIFTSEVRYGQKKQKYQGGGSGTESPIYSDDTGLMYNAGIFNSNDGGDHRDNKTAAIKGSLFLSGMGTHQIDAGIDYYEGLSKARNEQSPTNLIYEAVGMDPIARTGTPTAIWVFTSFEGEAKNFSQGLYINDKWTLNKFFSFQGGLRWDKYEAKNGNESTASASGLSPRLGLKYDLHGDSKWVFGASWGRYNGKVLENITNSVTSQGNPTEIDYGVQDAYANSVLTYAQIQNPNIYDHNIVYYYNDPTLNVKLNKGMKTPHVTEAQISAAYSYTSDKLGNGFVRLTAVDKKWADIIDYTTGINGLSNPDPTGRRYYMKVWDNQPDARRNYHDLEFDSQWNKGPFSATLAITWSSLKGNYEGEDTSSPGKGEGINAWNRVQLYTVSGSGVDRVYSINPEHPTPETMFDGNWKTPYGYLVGHVPLRIRGTFNYTKDWFLGKSSVGVIYRFDSGSHYSNTRSVDRTTVNPLLPSQAGLNITQYLDQTRGGGVYDSAASTDVALTHDFKLYKFHERPVTAFLKIVIQNLWNHQQVQTWNTTWANAGPDGQGFATAWGPARDGEGRTSFGQSLSSSDFATPRTIVASVGLRY